MRRDNLYDALGAWPNIEITTIVRLHLLQRTDGRLFCELPSSGHPQSVTDAQEKSFPSVAATCSPFAVAAVRFRALACYVVAAYDKPSTP
jgi:hypothetical protein